MLCRSIRLVITFPFLGRVDMHPLRQFSAHSLILVMQGYHPSASFAGSPLGSATMTTSSIHRPPPLARTNSKPLSEIIGAEPSIESWLHDEGKEGQETLHVPSVLERHLKRRPSTEVVIERGILMPITPEAQQSLSFANDPDGQQAAFLTPA